MKTLFLSLCLLLSFTALAQENFNSTTEVSGPVCGPDEVIVRVIVGRYCIVRDPILSTCMFWENLYKERCEPKRSSN